MSLEVILVLFYLILGILLIWNWSWFTKSGLSKAFLITLFLLKTLTSIYSGWLHKNYLNKGDSYSFLRAAEQLHSLRDDHPDHYKRMVFGKLEKPFPKELRERFNGKRISYYGHPRSYFMVRLNAVIRLVSNGYYNVHAVFFSFFSMIGLTALYGFFAKVITENKRILSLLLFLTPSVLFWGSGIHKEALVLLSMGLIFRSLELVDSKKYLYALLSLFLGVFIFSQVRDYILALFIPAILLLIWNMKSPKHIGLRNIVTYTLLGFCFFFAGKVNSKLNFPNKLIQVQGEFNQLNAHSKTGIATLEDNPQSFIKSVPAALLNTFVRPLPNKLSTKLQWAAFLENMAILFFLFYCLFHRKKNLSKNEESVLFFCLFFTLSFFILIGLTVTNFGAIVRYKSIGLLFLLIAGVIVAKPKAFYWISKPSSAIT